MACVYVDSFVGWNGINMCSVELNVEWVAKGESYLWEYCSWTHSYCEMVENKILKIGGDFI